ncbi:MAG: GntR family transcriptional regulator [Pseudonocardiales bacterium]|nr:GntR family transcriptional regulator [Pseudonocardiales bacterium]
MGVSRRERRPVYQQIAADLLHQISTGGYSPGDELPSLAELCQTYRVSKVTASSALAVLDRQGIIAVRHGSRAVVLPPATDSDEGDLVQVRRQISAMMARQERIVVQVQSLEQVLVRIQQQMHQLRQQDT